MVSGNFCCSVFFCFFFCKIKRRNLNLFNCTFFFILDYFVFDTLTKRKKRTKTFKIFNKYIFTVESAHQKKKNCFLSFSLHCLFFEGVFAILEGLFRFKSWNVSRYSLLNLAHINLLLLMVIILCLLELLWVLCWLCFAKVSCQNVSWVLLKE